MNSLQNIVYECKKQLEAAAILNPMQDVQNIISHIMGLEPEMLAKHADQFIDQQTHEKIITAIQSRVNRIPVERIFGITRFGNITIQVTNGVYKPYLETEDLIRHALHMLKAKKGPVRILDLGTGTGCILLSLLHELPHATGVGIDIDERAIDAARINAEANNLSGRAEFLIGNWAEGIEEKFDLVISNPPRVATSDLPHLLPEMRNHDPHRALDGGDDGLRFFQLLGKDFIHLSKPEACGLFQVGAKYAEQVGAVMYAAGLRHIAIKRNYLGLPSAIAVSNGLSENFFRGLQSTLLRLARKFINPQNAFR